MIDLHTHTTASDGRSTPAELVRRAAAAGIRTIAVTDHDTTAGLTEARTEAAACGVTVVAGIEITAVHDGRDVHVLGYFFDERSASLQAFLESQRADRRRRIGNILDRLADLGVPIDRAAVEADSRGSGRAIGRPAVARALVAAGHARSVEDAFNRFLATGRPGFVPRQGASPAEVIALLARAGGLASFAHPGKLGLDSLLPDLARAGLAAIEAFHPDHDEETTGRYVGTARALGLLVSGGSDYHGPGRDRIDALGHVGMPTEAFAALVSRARGER